MFARAASPDKLVTAESWRKQVEAYALPPTLSTQMLVMRDGTKLATDIHSPPGDGPFPVILSRTPYSRVKREKEAADFTRQGYVFVAQT